MVSIVPCPKCGSFNGMHLDRKCIDCGFYREPPPDWKARAEKAEAALRQIIDAANDIAEMAPHFVAARDVNSLRNYGSNIANIARMAIAPAKTEEPK